MQRKKAFFVNALILTITSLSMRSIGMLLQVYVTNQIGAVGIGLYSLITSVYGFALTFALSGISLSCTRLVAQELALNHPEGVKRAMRHSFLYSGFFGVVAALGLFFGAPFLSRYFVQDLRACSSLRILAISLPALSLSAAAGGYFTAVRRVYKSAAVQILEQLSKVAFTVLLLPFFVQKGLEAACCAVVFSSIAAELISFLILFLWYLVDKRRYKGKKGDVSPRLFRQLLSIGLPIAVSTYVRSALSTMNHLLIPGGLRRHGASSENALAQYGIIGGMALPVVNFPLAFIYSFATLVIPEVTESYTRKDENRIARIMGQVLQCTALFSIGMAGLFYTFADILGEWLYHQPEPAVFIRLLAPLVIVMYMDAAVDSILKGINKQLNSMGFNIIDSAISLLLICTLLPAYGIYGYVVVIFVSEIVNFALSLHCLIKATSFRIDLSRWLFRPVMCAALVSFLIEQKMAFSGESTLCEGIFNMLLWVLLYMLGLWISRCFPKRRKKEDISCKKRILKRIKLV